jgi:hypothetical protein
MIVSKFALRYPVSTIVGLHMFSGEILDHWQKSSVEVYQGKINERVVCVWGIILPTTFSNSAYLWMAHTEELGRHPFVFIRQSQIEIRKLLEVYPQIIGHAVIDNDKAKRWLRWLGAEFHTPVGNLHPFFIRRRTDD